MNQIEKLHDEIMGLHAQIEGKRLELALAQGDMTGAHLFKESMYRAIKTRVNYRTSLVNASIRPQVIVKPTEQGESHA
jgi:hypothetical protein